MLRFTSRSRRMASTLRSRAFFPLSSFSSTSQKIAPVVSTFQQKVHNGNQNPWGRGALIGSAAVALSAAAAFANDQAEACGIIGYVGNEPVTPYLIEGLTILQNRGYDSAGVATVEEVGKGKKKKGKLVTTKYASVGTTSDSIKILADKVPDRHGKASTGIAHTRWATHGGKTDENAHPHSDYKNRIALVHNGTIQNSFETKKRLQKIGIPFKSETDTEVIVNLIGHYLDKGMSTVDATKKALSELEGTWGIAIVSTAEPNRIIAARRGSPLVVGISNGRKFIASEVCAFSRHTTQYVALNDDELVVLTAGDNTFDMTRVEKAPEEVIELSPEPFPHWTIKEITEQPAALSRTLHYGGRFDSLGNVKLGGLDENKDMLLPIKHLLVSGCGTSFFAGSYGTLLFRYLGCFDSVQAIDASEVTIDSFPENDGGLLVLSQSGETKDTMRALGKSAEIEVPRFSIVNQVGSLIARTTKCGVYLYAGREHAVASTKAFTTQVTALALTAGWFAQNRSSPRSTTRRRDLMDAVHKLPIYAGMALRSHNSCKEVAKFLKEKDHMFILGKGFAEPIAQEAALKIKEITYLHAEGFSGGALKHGPFALLEKDTPVVLFILSDEHRKLMRIAAEEVRARGAKTIIVTDDPKLAEDVADYVITIPHNGPLTALLGVIPMQLLAYELALLKGIDPDKPKNLAKAVTVD